MVDSLAKQALQNDQAQYLFPYSDLKPIVNTYIKQRWQNEWNSEPENKLYQTRPVLDDNEHLTAVTTRKEETVLSRLHTGHSYLTQIHLLKGEDPPFCIACNEVMTIKHLLLDCADLIDVRENYFTVNSLKDLFCTVPPQAVFGFLKEINVYHLI